MTRLDDFRPTPESRKAFDDLLLAGEVWSAPTVDRHPRSADRSASAVTGSGERSEALMSGPAIVGRKDDVVVVAPGGHTPRHTHPWPHINFIASGSGSLHVAGEDHPLAAGSYAYVPADV